MNPLRTEMRFFNASDFDNFRFFGDEKEAALAQAAKIELLSNSGNDRGFASLCLCGGVPLFVGGYFERSPGVAEVFIIPDQDGVTSFPKTFHKLVSRYLKWVLSKEWCKKVETASVDHPRINAWMTALSFSFEGYNDSGDYRKWGRWA